MRAARARKRLAAAAAAGALVLVAASIATPAGSTPLSRGTLAFVPPTYGPGQSSIDGKYRVEGVEPSGDAEPTGVAVITRLGAEAYDMYELIDGARYDAICVLRAGVLGCGWSVTTRPLGVVVYTRSSRPDVSLEGVFRDERGIGHELLGKPPDSFEGDFRVLPASVLPSGGSYGGSVHIVSGSIYQMSGELTGGAPSDSRFGYGVRDGDTLSIGFNADGNCGVVEYRIAPGGRVLSGRWLDGGRPYAGLGTETLTRM